MATPDPGWRFDHWGGLFDLTPTVDLLITQDYTLTAFFVQDSFTLTLLVEGTGTTDPSPGSYTGLQGTTYNLAAVETDSQWIFDHWAGDIGSAEPTSSAIYVVLDNDLTVTAVFVPRPMRTLFISTGRFQAPPRLKPVSFTVMRTANVVILSATGDYGWQFLPVVRRYLVALPQASSIIVLAMDPRPDRGRPTSRNCLSGI